MSNVKNYVEQGGKRSVIEGELAIVDEGVLTLYGMQVSRAVFQEDSIAGTVTALKDDLNALLAKLRAAGLMESE